MRGHPGEPTTPPAYIRVFEAVLALDRGCPAEALATLSAPGSDFFDLIFASWHTALAAEAAVLANHVHADDMLLTAHVVSTNESIPGLIARRAASLRRNDHPGQNVAEEFAALGAPYQEKRSRILTRAP